MKYVRESCVWSGYLESEAKKSVSPPKSFSSRPFLGGGPHRPRELMGTDKKVIATAGVDCFRASLPSGGGPAVLVAEIGGDGGFLLSRPSSSFWDGGGWGQGSIVHVFGRAPTR